MLEEKFLSSADILKRLIKNHVVPYKKQVVFAAVFMVIAALCSALIVRVTQPVVDQVLINRDRNSLFLVSVFIVAVYSIKGVAEFYQSYLIKFVGQRVLTDLQMLMYNHLLRSDFLFLHAQSSGKLISRFTNDITLMRRAVTELLVGCAKHFLSVVFLIAIMFSLDPLLSALVFLAFPVAIYPIQKLGKRMRKVTSLAQEELSNFTGKLDETFRAIKVIKCACLEDHETSQARKMIDNILSFYRRSIKFDSLTSPIMEILSGITITCVIWYGTFSIEKGEMTTGTLFTFITAFVSSYRPFKSLVSLNVNLQESIAAANRIFNILDLKPKIIDSPESQEIDLTSASIEFQDVSMRFDSGKNAIKSINILVPAGKIYAFVGESGSGKTTITNLLTRMFDPTRGVIKFGGVDLKKFKLDSLRSQTALIAQDTMLFDASIAENIAYGAQGIGREQIITAAKQANADRFIIALPQGYDTLIGNNGCILSGGQRQRLSIARALLKNAPIMILDEATSALDPKSEQKVMDSIFHARQNKTTIIITHRLASIIRADCIIVMQNGFIVETGGHEELLAKKGEYYRLHNKELQEGVKDV